MTTESRSVPGPAGSRCEAAPIVAHGIRGVPRSLRPSRALRQAAICGSTSNATTKRATVFIMNDTVVESIAEDDAAAKCIRDLLTVTLLSNTSDLELPSVSARAATVALVGESLETRRIARLIIVTESGTAATLLAHATDGLSS